METTNRALIERAFDIMHEPMVDYIYKVLIANCGDKWWDKLLSLVSVQARKNLTASDAEMGDSERLDQLDIAACLQVIGNGWNKIFVKDMPKNAKNYAHELLTNRNQHAHRAKKGKDISYDDASRVLDTMRMLCEIFDDRLGSSAGYENGLMPADKIKQLEEQLCHDDRLSSSTNEASEDSSDDSLKKAEEMRDMVITGFVFTVVAIVCARYFWDFFSLAFGIIAGLVSLIGIIFMLDDDIWYKIKSGTFMSVWGMWEEDCIGPILSVTGLLLGSLFLWEDPINTISLIAAVSGGFASFGALISSNVNELKISAAVTAIAALGYYFTL